MTADLQEPSPIATGIMQRQGRAQYLEDCQTDAEPLNPVSLYDRPLGLGLRYTEPPNLLQDAEPPSSVNMLPPHHLQVLLTLKRLCLLLAALFLLSNRLCLFTTFFLNQPDYLPLLPTCLYLLRTVLLFPHPSYRLPLIAISGTNTIRY